MDLCEEFSSDLIADQYEKPGTPEITTTARTAQQVMMQGKSYNYGKCESYGYTRAVSTVNATLELQQKAELWLLTAKAGVTECYLCWFLGYHKC